MAAGGNDRAEVIALPPLIVAAVLVVGFVLHLLRPVGFLPSGAAPWLGAVLIALAILLAAAAVRQLIRAKTTFDVRKPTTAIVTSSVFGLTRNPIYLSMVLGYLGIAALADSLWLLLLTVPLVVVLQKGVIEREERYLEGKFGDDYRRYKTRVRRWI